VSCSYAVYNELSNISVLSFYQQVLWLSKITEQIYAYWNMNHLGEF